MATVVDALVVTLGLDPKDFTKGQKQAAAELVKTRQAAQKEGAAIEKSLDGAAEAVDRLARNALKLFAIFTAGRAVKEFVSDITAADAAMGRLAKSIGSTPEAISSLANAVARNGGSASAAAGSFERLSDSINELKTTGNSSILPVFARLQGISGRQIRLNTDLATTFGDIAEASKVSAEKVGVSQTSYLLKQAGYDQGTIALLIQGRAKLNEALEKSRRIGIVNEKDAKAAQALETSIESLRQTSESFGRSILTTLTPTITDLLERFQRWITANQDWIRTGIVENVKQFATWIKGIDWDGVGKGLQDFGAGALKVADAFGGILKVCEALFLFWVGSKAIAIVRSILGIAGLLSAGPLGWAICLAMAASIGSDVGVPNADKPGVITRSDDENTGAAVAPSRGHRDPRIDRDRGVVRDYAGRAWRGVKRLFGGGDAEAHEGGAGIRARARRAKLGPDGIPYEAKSLTEGVGVSQKQYDAYREGLTDIEGKSYTQVGGAGGRYSGRYQFGPNEIRQTAVELGEKPPTRAQFLADPAMQERYMERYTLDHHNFLMRRSQKYRDLPPEKRLEILGYAHNQGAGRGGALTYLESGKVGSDGFGTPGTAYFGPIRKRLAEIDKNAPTAATRRDILADPNDERRKAADPTIAESVAAVRAMRAAQREQGTLAERAAAGSEYGPQTPYPGSRSIKQMNDWLWDKKGPQPTDWKKDPATGNWKPVFEGAKPNAALGAQQAGAQAAIAQVQAAQAATVSSTANDNRSTDNSSQWHIENLNLQTAATDGRAAAHDFRSTLSSRSFAAAANRGLA
ncbi:hypothetical protein [Methylobacterium fujisawaense]|uniref:hypothetical protein n=1 Tax=Methylobacterium fujisawaense TaxID=107400 RepID=UPI00313CF560